MLKKKENSLYRVRGRKLHGVYFALETTFAGYLDVWACPTRTSRGGLVSGMLFAADRREYPKREALRLEKRNRRPGGDTRSSSLNERVELRLPS